MAMHIKDEAGMQALGNQLGGSLRHGIVWLEGQLGAGKTTLARAILHGRGYNGRVKSPTYTLVEPYELADGVVYHIDLYRLADAEELEWLGLRDLLESSSLLLVEWPERGAGVLPDADLCIRITPAGQGRMVSLEARSPLGHKMLGGVDSM